MERQADGLSWKRKFNPPSAAHLRMLISFFKKNQLCYGVMLTIILPECHANKSSWSEVDKDLFDKVRQFILDLVRSVGLPAHKVLPLTDNLIWSEEGSPHFNTDYLHARTAFYTQHSIVAGLVPTNKYQRWWALNSKIVCTNIWTHTLTGLPSTGQGLGRILPVMHHLKCVWHFLSRS